MCKVISAVFISPSKPTVCRAVHQFVAAVNAEMENYVTLDGSEANWRQHSKVFFEDMRTRLPHVVGAIDGTYIRIKNIRDEDAWFCRKGFAAINLTIMVDSAMMIRFATMKMSGATHDITVYRNSLLAELVEQGWRPFQNAWILGDSAYQGIRDFIIPYQHRPLNPANFRFYRRVSRSQ